MPGPTLTGAGWLVDEIDTGVVYINDAGTALVSGDGTTLIPVIGGLSTTNSAAAASANVTAIQAALNNAGLVQILAPGTYYINAALIAYDNTRIVLGEGVTIKNYSGTSKSLLTNSCYLNTLVSASSVTASSRTVTVVAAGHGFTSADVGTYACLLGSTTDGYSGIWPVASVSGNNVALTVDEAPTVTTAAGTMSIVKANYNIEITGGAWDYDTTNNPSVGTYNNHVIRFNFIRRGRAFDTSILNGTKYAIHFVSSHDCSAKDIFMQTASDGVHFDGMAVNPTVQTIKGRTGDDFVAFTIFKASPAGAYAYTLPPSYYPGNVTGANVGDLSPSDCYAAVKLAGTTGWKFKGLSVNCIKGFGRRAAVSCVDDTADLTGGGGSGIVLRDINYTSQLTTSSIMEWQQTGTVEDITLDGVSDNIAGSVGILIGGPVNTINIRAVKIRAVKTAAFMQINVANVNVVNFSEVDGLSGAAGMLLTTTGNTYTVGQVNIDKINWTASSATGYVVYINGGAAHETTEVNVSNFKLTGGGAGVGTFCAVNAGKLVRINFSNGNAKSSGVLLNYSAGAVAAAPTVKFSNVEFDTTNRYVDLRLGGTVFINNVRSSGLSSQPIFAGGTSQTYIVKAAAWQHGLTEVFGYGTTPLITCYGWDIATDPIANLQTTAGQFMYSTRATAINQGPCVRTAAGWIALGTGASGVNTVAT